MPAATKQKKLLTDEDIRKLVVARLSVLSPSTMISLGSAGSFTRDQLVDNVQNGSDIGEKLTEIQLEWLRSFKQDGVL